MLFACRAPDDTDSIRNLLFLIPSLMNRKIIPLLTALSALFLAQYCFAEDAKPAPACQLTRLDNGQALDWSSYRGQVVYVDFWASWCGPCVESFPFMNKLENELKDQGLAVIAVDLDEEPEDGKRFVAEHPVAFTVAADSQQQCAKQFQVKAMPSSYLIDRKGMIREVHLGFRPGEAEEFRKLVEKILAE